MTGLNLKSLGAVFVPVLCALLIAGCVRYKNSETASDSPSAPGSANRSDLNDIPSGETYLVKFETSKGNFTIEVHPAWAPLGAAQFKKLVESGYYNECRFFRVVPGFVVQWGMNGDPELNAEWEASKMQDDPVLQKNARGTVTFATSGPNSRTTQLFINYGDNSSSLDSQGFAPFGMVVEGMDVVESINSEYGQKPNQGKISSLGNSYLKEQYPRLDYIIKATFVDSAESPKEKESPQESKASPGNKKGEQKPKSDTEKPATSEKLTTTEEKKASNEKAEAQPETIEEIK